METTGENRRQQEATGGKKSKEEATQGNGRQEEITKAKTMLGQTMCNTFVGTNSASQ